MLLVAGAVAGEVTVKNVSMLSKQADTAICTALVRAGAAVINDEDSVTASHRPLRAFEFDATHCPDLFPALAALAAAAQGESVIRGTSRLEHKECNRADAIREEYAKAGIEVDTSQEDVMRIRGGRIRQARVQSHGDHRMAMSLAVAALRSKEDAQDYRYFPEPDLPPVVLDEAFLSQVRRSMPELPEQKRARYLAEYGLTERDAAILLRSARLCRLLEGLIGRGIPAREAANWTLGEVLRLLGEDGLEPADLEIDEEKLARALRLLAAGRIGRPAARRAVEAVYREGADPELFCREHGLFLEKVGEGDLAAAVAKVLAENADAVEKYRAGSDKVFGFLVGRCMAALRGKADPASVNRALREALKR